MFCKECDRCGKVYKPYHKIEVDGKQIRGNGAAIIDASDARNLYDGLKGYDLCEDCFKDFLNWFERKE